MIEPDFTALPFGLGDVVDIQIRQLGISRHVEVWPSWASQAEQKAYVVWAAQHDPALTGEEREPIVVASHEARRKVCVLVDASRRLLGRPHL